MSNRMRLPRTLLTAAVLAACAAPALAQDPVPPNTEGVSARDTEPLSEQRPTFPVTPSRPAEARTPLMNLLDQVGLAGPLDDARIRVYGHVQGSYTFNFQDPFQDINAGRVFDVEHDELLLNQLVLNVQRDVNISKTDFDIGGRMEWMYGSDARFIHANGLFDWNDDEETTGVAPGPENQFDLVQAYADVNIPVGNGLRVRAGKFTYFKQIDPNASVFYSHSYTFGAALPFTLTGIYGTYQFTDDLTVDAGINRGWDQALEDNNGNISFHGRVKYNISDRTSVAAAVITGPEQDDDNRNYRTAIDLVLSHQVNEDLLLLFDLVYGAQAQADYVRIIPGALGGRGAIQGPGGTANWYGLSAFAVQRLNEQFSLAGRVEVFRDEEGYTTSVNQTLWEATAGLIITPFPNDPYGQYLKIRPEIRYDYSSKEFFDAFTSDDQLTAAVDIVYNF